VMRRGVEAGKSWNEISEALPGCTVRAMETRGRRLGLKDREGRAEWKEISEGVFRAALSSPRSCTGKGSV
jgi:hypothetical protein